MAIPRYPAYRGPALFSAGFRPFFLLAGVQAAIGIPLWLAAYAGGVALPGAFPPLLWHGHEMIFGYAMAAVAGFLLTAIPNWTGRLPLNGLPLLGLTLLWLLGRCAMLAGGLMGPAVVAVLDLAFPVVFMAAVAREILAGRNWRNLPVLAALALLLAGNLLMHLEALGWAQTAALGLRLGIGTLCALIALIGGRITPSFTANWLKKQRPGTPLPAPAGRFDLVALIVTLAGLAAWVAAPDWTGTAWAELVAGLAVAARLARWRGLSTLREPLLASLHLGYGWLAAGLLVLGINGLTSLFPATTALHALTVGAIGTMTLAVMTRATLGHTGRRLEAGAGTTAIYAAITIAALLRLAAPLADARMMTVLWASGAAWVLAFGLFLLIYGRMLATPHPA